MIGLRQWLAMLVFVVIVPVMAVVAPPLVGPAAAHDDPLEDKLELLNSLPPDLAPDRSDLQIVGLESWLAPNRLTAILPVPDAHRHRFLFWSYPESYIALPRRSIFNFADGVSRECGRNGSRYSPGAAGPPECGRDWFHTTAVLPMWVQTQMEYRVIRLTPFPKVYTKRTDRSVPYLLDVGEIQAIGKEIGDPVGAPVSGTPSTPIADCSLVDTSLGPCVAPDDIIDDVIPVSGDGDWPPLPTDPCADEEPILMASIDAAAIQAAMAAAAANPCGDETGDPDDPDTGDDPTEDLPDPFAPTDDDPPPVISCDDIEEWRPWLDCVRRVVVDELAAIAHKVYELLPDWAKAVVRALDGCAEFGGEALRDIWEAFKSAGEALSDFPTWLEQKLREIRELVDAIRSDPEAFVNGALKDWAEADLYNSGDKAKWVGKMTCKVAAAVLLGGSAKLLADLKNFKNRDRSGDCNSFPAGTPVLMADGRRLPIEQVRPGDLVLAANPANGRWQPRAVLDRFSHLDEGQMATVTLVDGSSLTATDHHLFFVASDGAWMELADVRPGDALLTPSGVATVARVIEGEPTETAVWDLDTAIDDTFAVSTGGHDLLVHNCDYRRPDTIDSDQLFPPTRGILDHRKRYRDHQLDEARRRHGDDSTFDEDAARKAIDDALAGHQIHHLIPQKVAEHPMLQRLGIDVNDPQNLRPLPCPGTPCGAAHLHSGQHPNYSKAVTQMLDGIEASGLDDAAKKTAVADLLDRLHDGVAGDGPPVRNTDGATTEDWVRYLGGG